MARPLRIEFPDAIYHVTSRGNARQAIVRDVVDQDKWMELLQRTVERYGWRLFAFALMTNHYHLFLQTPDPNLSEGMQHLNGSMAGYVNARHGSCGHVFQGRFKAIVVERVGHWIELSRYVHLNPVRAGLTDKPEGWRWGSYPGYHLKRKRMAWVDYGPVMAEVGGDTPSARRRYRRLMEEGLGRKLDSPLAEAEYGLALGSEAFVDSIRRMVSDRAEDAELPALSRLRARPDMEGVLHGSAEHFGGDPARWVAGRRCDEMGRAVAAYLARDVCGARGPEIAARLGYRNVSSVAGACRRVQVAAAERRFAKKLAKVRRALLL